MITRSLYLFFFLGCHLCLSQMCPLLTEPLNNTEEVPTNTIISWEPVEGIRGYYITVGTRLGLRDIVDREFVGNNNFYVTPEDLPPDTTIYVKITLAFFGNRPVMTCNVERFSTGAPIPIPECTELIHPFDGETDVPLRTTLEWRNVRDAAEYRITIGSYEGSNDFLDATFESNSTPELVFKSNSTYFITITPSNTSGNALGCAAESFSTTFGCDPYVDETGELVDPRPKIDFPDQLDICLNKLPVTFVSQDTAEGFRWFKVDTDGTETLVSETATFMAFEEGNYRYEAYNNLTRFGNTIECAKTKTVTVVASQIAAINLVDISRELGGNRIEIDISGMGDYEYALNSENGPYQTSNSFDNLPDGLYTVYVRDKDGCGIAKKEIMIVGYPKFFTPNADGKNDTWHLTAATSIDIVNEISIFDRYGKLIRVLLPDELGWDGNFNGVPLPSSDYWFKTALANGAELKGHFTLKR